MRNNVAQQQGSMHNYSPKKIRITAFLVYRLARAKHTDKQNGYDAGPNLNEISN